ncbi:MAG: hypothetical protein D8H95_02355 [Lachnospiraceae bacterium]|nr:MAG: hypothetical protein D8H95_02355 [Lachnospiraceae bacterium]
MNGGDPEANYAYYCLHKFHWKPTEFIEMSEEEMAFVIAAIDIKAQNDKKHADELKSKIRR